MYARYLLTTFIFCTTCASAADDPLISLKHGQPKEVRQLIDRLAGCNHWGSEEPYDAERKQEIASAVAELKCARLAQDDAAARRRFADKPATIKALRQAHETSL